MKLKLLAAMISVMTLVSGAFAQPGRAFKDSTWIRHRPMMLMHNRLNLTDEQRKEVQKIRFDMMQKQIDIRAKIAHARLDYEQLTSADSPDENSIAAKIDEIAKLKSQLKKNMLDSWFAINRILTPDQQKIWRTALQHPFMVGKRMMLKMRTVGRRGGAMRWGRPNVGMTPMNGGQTFGEAGDDYLNMNQMSELGPLADSYIILNEEDPLTDDTEEMFNEPSLKLDTMGYGNLPIDQFESYDNDVPDYPVSGARVPNLSK
jgi:Spy/CpxP family protein refolding chaperone